MSASGSGEAVEPRALLRGSAFRAAPGVPYPRARDDARLPRDTWGMAQVPACVRLEFVGDADGVAIRYRSETDDPGFRGPGGGLSFQCWRGGSLVSEEKAVVGEGTVELSLGDGFDADERVIVYLPEIMRPTIESIDALGGSIEPAPDQPQWVAYGDSILEGWSTSAPALGWGARVARAHGLDIVNMGYAGSARGELASAEHVASRRADVYSVTHGTNCWTVVPHSVDMMRAAVDAFLTVIRDEHPDTPIVVSSPVLRPDAEATPNRLGATLADLRHVMEEVATERIDAGDHHLTLVSGEGIIDDTMLADGIHPDDEGHAAMAEAIGPAIVQAVKG